MLKKIAASKLAVSEPNPSWFGNPGNEKLSSWTNENWLKSRFHFNFAEYSNPRNRDFGVLRVLNDDLVQPDRGFGEHGHQEAEIVTFIVDGALTHKDSMGTAETLGRGAIQFMTAGRGVTHSERNLDKENPLRFVQIWMTPRSRGLKPNYGSAAGDAEKRKNTFTQLVGDVKNNTCDGVKINCDANIYVAEIEPGQTATFNIAAGRMAYFLDVEGDITITDGGGPQEFAQHDAAEARGETKLQVKANTRAMALIVEMKDTPGGRGDI